MKLTTPVSSRKPGRRAPGALLGVAALVLFRLTPSPAISAPAPAVPEPDRSGQELAQRLRELGPAKSASFSGKMTITRRDRTNTYPIRSTISAGPTNWQIRYTAMLETSNETFTVVRSPSSPPEYFTSNAASIDGLGQRLTPDQLFAPFAGSDFWRVDLALDFFQWPKQRHTTNEMRRGAACRVLESTRPNPAPGTYGRVTSWLTVEGDGILRAEAFNHQNGKLKEFLPGKTRKVNGQRQLEEMSMRIHNSKNETSIRFDLDQP